MGGFGGADGGPDPTPPADPVLVIPDRRSPVAPRCSPGQHDLAVPAHRRQVPGRSRRGQPRLGWRLRLGCCRSGARWGARSVGEAHGNRTTIGPTHPSVAPDVGASGLPRTGVHNKRAAADTERPVRAGVRKTLVEHKLQISGHGVQPVDRIGDSVVFEIGIAELALVYRGAAVPVAVSDKRSVHGHGKCSHREGCRPDFGLRLRLRGEGGREDIDGGEDGKQPAERPPPSKQGASAGGSA